MLDNIGMVLGVYRAGNQEKHSAEPGFGPWDDCTAWLGPGHAQQQWLHKGRSLAVVCRQPTLQSKLEVSVPQWVYFNTLMWVCGVAGTATCKMSPPSLSRRCKRQASGTSCEVGQITFHQSGTEALTFRAQQAFQHLMSLKKRHHRSYHFRNRNSDVVVHIRRGFWYDMQAHHYQSSRLQAIGASSISGCTSAIGTSTSPLSTCIGKLDMLFRISTDVSKYCTICQYVLRLKMT